MASFITSSLTSEGTNYAIKMSNSTFARPLTIPSTWQSIRIGIHLWMPPDNSSPTGTPRFAFGLSSGTSNQVGDSNTTHFVGVITNSNTWTKSGSFSYNSIAFAPCVKVGTTMTTGSNMTGDSRLGISSSLACLWALEITKGSPYTFKLWAPSVIANNLGITTTQFNIAMNAAKDGITLGSVGTPQTLAVNEATNGTLNAINFWWNRTDMYPVIYNMAVVLLS